MSGRKRVQLTAKIDSELRRKIRLWAVERGLTLAEYLEMTFPGNADAATAN